MFTESLRNFIHREALRIYYRFTRRVPCIVDSYNDQAHTVKVKLQPEGTLTGWMQIQTAQVGLMIAPNIGDPGWIEFHENDRRAGVFVASVHNNTAPPPQQIAAGEFFYKNTKGQTIYAKNDGSITTTDGAGASNKMQSGVVTLTDKAGSTTELDGAGNIQLTPQGGNVMVNGNLIVSQSIDVENQNGASKPFQVTGNINLTGTLAASGDVTAGSISLQNHTHPAPGGETGPPTG